MGKISTAKKYRGCNRDAGAFHPLEVLEAKKEKVQDEKKEFVSAEEAALSRGQRKRLAKKMQKLRKSMSYIVHLNIFSI